MRYLIDAYDGNYMEKSNEFIIKADFDSIFCHLGNARLESLLREGKEDENLEMCLLAVIKLWKDLNFSPNPNDYPIYC